MNITQAVALFVAGACPGTGEALGSRVSSVLEAPTHVSLFARGTFAQLSGPSGGERRVLFGRLPMCLSAQVPESRGASLFTPYFHLKPQVLCGPAEAATGLQPSRSLWPWVCMMTALRPLSTGCWGDTASHQALPEKLLQSLVRKALCDERHLRCIRLIAAEVASLCNLNPFPRFTLMEGVGEEERKA